MLTTFYHGVTKSVIGGFGALFSNIMIERRKDDSVNGDIIQTIKVPIRFAPRRVWFNQLLDPQREKQVAITLPRMCFELSTFAYDSSRKKTRAQTIKCTDENGNTTAVATPAPWNLGFQLYIVSNNQEDCLQIVEQILPYFNPDYTLKIKTALGLVINVPISLSSVAMQDDYEGSYTGQKFVVYTLDFVAKVDYYGRVIDSQPTIGNVQITTGVGDDDKGEYLVTFESNGTITSRFVWEYRGNTQNEIQPQSPCVKITEPQNNLSSFGKTTNEI